MYLCSCNYIHLYYPVSGGSSGSISSGTVIIATVVLVSLAIVILVVLILVVIVKKSRKSNTKNIRSIEKA